MASRAAPPPLAPSGANAYGGRMPDAPDTAALAPRLRFLRRQHGLTLEALAQASGLTRSFLSKLERGLATPSITTTLRLAGALGISVGRLVGEAEDPGAVAILRKRERHGVMAEGAADDYLPLLPGRPHAALEAWVMRPPAGFRPGPPGAHAGEELLFVLSGAVEVEFGSRLERLEAGDAAQFDASLPHRTRSLGAGTEVLVVMHRPRTQDEPS